MANPYVFTTRIALQGVSSADFAKISSQIQNFVNTTPLRFNISLSSAAVAQIKQLDTSVSSLSSGLTNLSTAFGKFNTNLNQSAAGATKVATATRGAKVAQDQFNSSIEYFAHLSALALKRYSAFVLSTAAVWGMVRATSTAVTEAVKFDRIMVRLGQVIDNSKESVRGIKDEIANLSKAWGVSATDLGKAAQTLAMAGFSYMEVKSTLAAVAKATLLPSFGEGDIAGLDNLIEGLIAVKQQFKIEAKDFASTLSQINVVVAKYAIETQDVFEAVRRGGSAFAGAGGKFHEFLALFTAIRGTTRESAESIATAMRMIFNRLQRSSTVDVLESLNIKLREFNKISGQMEFVGPYEAIARISKGLEGLSTRSPLYAKIVEEIGGARHLNKVIPLLTQQNTILEANRLAKQASNDLDKQAAEGSQALSVQLSKVNEQFRTLIRDVMSDKIFRGMLSVILDMTKGFLNLADSIRGLLPILVPLMTLKAVSSAFQFIPRFGSTLVAKGTAHTRASGGMIPGSGNTDSVHAMLTPGEYVFSKQAVNNIGLTNIEAIHRGAKGYAAGGLVHQDRNMYGDFQTGRKFTDEQLRQAAASAKSISDIQKGLGLSRGGRSNALIKSEMGRLGIGIGITEVHPPLANVEKPQSKIFIAQDKEQQQRDIANRRNLYLRELAEEQRSRDAANRVNVNPLTSLPPSGAQERKVAMEERIRRNIADSRAIRQKRLDQRDAANKQIRERNLQRNIDAGMLSQGERLTAYGAGAGLSSGKWDLRNLTPEPIVMGGTKNIDLRNQGGAFWQTRSGRYEGIDDVGNAGNARANALNAELDRQATAKARENYYGGSKTTWRGKLRHAFRTFSGTASGGIFEKLNRQKFVQGLSETRALPGFMSAPRQLTPERLAEMEAFKSLPKERWSEAIANQGRGAVYPESTPRYGRATQAAGGGIAQTIAARRGGGYGKYAGLAVGATLGLGMYGSGQGWGLPGEANGEKTSGSRITRGLLGGLSAGVGGAMMGMMLPGGPITATIVGIGAAAIGIYKGMKEFDKAIREQKITDALKSLDRGITDYAKSGKLSKITIGFQDLNDIITKQEQEYGKITKKQRESYDSGIKRTPGDTDPLYDVNVFGQTRFEINKQESIDKWKELKNKMTGKELSFAEQQFTELAYAGKIKSVADLKSLKDERGQLLGQSIYKTIRVGTNTAEDLGMGGETATIKTERRLQEELESIKKIRELNFMFQSSADQTAILTGYIKDMGDAMAMARENADGFTDNIHRLANSMGGQIANYKVDDTAVRSLKYANIMPEQANATIQRMLGGRSKVHEEDIEYYNNEVERNMDNYGRAYGHLIPVDLPKTTTVRQKVVTTIPGLLGNADQTLGFGAGAKSIDYLQQLTSLRSALPNVIEAMQQSQTEIVGKANAPEFISKMLGDKLRSQGFAPNKALMDNLAGGFDKIINKGESAGAGNLGNFDRFAISEELLKNSKPFTDALHKIAEESLKVQQQFADVVKVGEEHKLKIVEFFTGTVRLRQQQGAESQRRAFEYGNSGYATLDPEKFRQDLITTQSRLTGVKGEDSLDSEVLGNKILALRTERDAQALSNRQFSTGNQEGISKVVQLDSAIARTERGLNNLAQGTEYLTAIQARLAEIDKRRSEQFQGWRSKLTMSPGQRARLERNTESVKDWLTSGRDLDTLNPYERRQLEGVLQQNPNERFKNRSGEMVTIEQGARAWHDVKYPMTKEEQDIQDKWVDARTNQRQANEKVLGIMGSANADIQTEIVKQQRQIAQEFASIQQRLLFDAYNNYMAAQNSAQAAQAQNIQALQLATGAMAGVATSIQQASANLASAKDLTINGQIAVNVTGTENLRTSIEGMINDKLNERLGVQNRANAVSKDLPPQWSGRQMA